MAKEELTIPDNEIAIVQDAGNNALDILNQHVQTIAYDPGFMALKPNKGAKSFDAGALGTMDGPLECIIFSVNTRRTLWTPDQNIGTEQLAAALQMMPKDVEKYNASEVSDWCSGRPLCGSSNNGGTKGGPLKLVDADAPDIVGKLLTPPAKAGYSCSKCKWNEYGSDFKGGAGKACQEKPMLLLYFYKEDMAATISLPPTSIKAWRAYKTSFPGQNFSAVFTSISTAPTTKNGNTFNLIECEPVKVKGSMVPIEATHMAALGEPIVYGGREVAKLEALLAEFLEIELEDEEIGGGDDIPFEDGGNSEGNAPEDF